MRRREQHDPDHLTYEERGVLDRAAKRVLRSLAKRIKDPLAFHVARFGVESYVGMSLGFDSLSLVSRKPFKHLAQPEYTEISPATKKLLKKAARAVEASLRRKFPGAYTPELDLALRYARVCQAHAFSYELAFAGAEKWIERKRSESKTKAKAGRSKR